MSDRYVIAWMQRLFFVAAIGLFAMAVYGRGPVDREGLGPAEAVLVGAVLANPIPLAPGATFTTVTTGQLGSASESQTTFTSKAWLFRISDPVAKVATFYRNNLPVGAKESTPSAESVAFRWSPPGAWDGEVVWVTVRRGELQIAETVKVGR